MKKVGVIVYIIISVALIGLTGCNDSQGGGTPKSSKIEQDAIDTAKRLYFSKVIIKCGDFTYARSGVAGFDDFGSPLVRVKNTGSFKVDSNPLNPLSEADKLNGYQWKGAIIFTASGPSQQKPSNETSYREWTDFPIVKAITVEKKNNEWGLSGFNPGYPIIKQISCEEVEPNKPQSATAQTLPNSRNNIPSTAIAPKGGEELLQDLPLTGEFKRYAGYPADLMKISEFKNAYSRIVMPSIKDDWIKSLKGIDKPNTAAAAEIGTYIIASLCEPHGCNVQQLIVIYSYYDKKCWGLISGYNSQIWLGNPTSEIQEVLNTIYAKTHH